MGKGRKSPIKVHKDDLDPQLNKEIEQVLLMDVQIFSARGASRMRVFKRPYVQGECNPYRLPDPPRTRVEVTRGQRNYYVDNEFTLYVDLRPRLTAEEKAERKAQYYERKKDRIPGGARGKQMWRIVRTDVLPEGEDPNLVDNPSVEQSAEGFAVLDIPHERSHVGPVPTFEQGE